MINEKLGKIISSFILAIYVVGHSATACYCVTTNSSLQLRRPAPQRAVKLEGDTIISAKNPKISLSLRDADVKQVLRMFADKAGKNIVFHPSALVETSTTNNTNNNNNNNNNRPMPLNNNNNNNNNNSSSNNNN